MSSQNKKFVKSMIILGCNWLTVSKIKNSGKVWFRWCVMVGREDVKKEVILVYSLVMLVMDINSICKTQLTDTYEERIFSK